MNTTLASSRKSAIDSLGRTDAVRFAKKVVTVTRRGAAFGAVYVIEEGRSKEEIVRDFDNLRSED